MREDSAGRAQGYRGPPCDPARLGLQAHRAGRAAPWSGTHRLARDRPGAIHVRGVNESMPVRVPRESAETVPMHPAVSAALSCAAERAVAGPDRHACRGAGSLCAGVVAGDTQERYASRVTDAGRYIRSARHILARSLDGMRFAIDPRACTSRTCDSTAAVRRSTPRAGQRRHGPGRARCVLPAQSSLDGSSTEGGGVVFAQRTGGPPMYTGGADDRRPGGGG